MSTGSRREIVLPEDDAQAVVLVQAVEEGDRGGGVLPLAARREASARACEAHPGSDVAWLAARARELTGVLERDRAFLRRFLRFTCPVRGLLAPAVVVAFVLGLATNALGPEKRINVLAVPLLGLIAWNLGVLALMAARAWLPLPSVLAAGAPRFVRRLEAMGRRLAERLPRADADGASLRPGLEGYLARWLPAAAPLAAARGRRLLHASSLALILGVVAGMYLRGIAFQYQATWESTFLGGGTIDRFLGTLLAPAAAVLGTAVPSAAAIEAPATGDAALWIHLWAVTAGLFAGLPRLTLAAFEGLRCARRRRRVAVSLPEGYVRRLLASVDTSEKRLEVIPFSYRPPPAAVAALKRLLYDLCGPRSEIRLRQALEYGFEPEDLEPGDSRLQVVLFGLAQTPEVEVHGELLHRLEEELADGQALVVLVDGSSYRQRLAGDGHLGERLEERRRAWDRVVREVGLAAVHLDLAEPLGDEELTIVVESAWPPGSLGGRG